MYAYDCIIVGSGPAGGSAAYHLAKQGRSVLVVEKAALPRYKPCGGGVSPVVGEWFDFDFSPAISLTVDTIRYTWKMGAAVEAEIAAAEPIWMVRRDVFDHFLIQQARQQGAELRDETEARGIEFQSDRWQVSTPDGPVWGRYLIAADGAKGPMARWLGFKQRKARFGGAIEAEALGDVAAPTTAHFEFGMVKNGYIWNFPKADGYSIGIGTFRGGQRQPLQEIATEYSQMFDVDFKGVQRYGHPLWLWDGDQTLHTQNAVLAGEAACVVDPFTAEGIRPSIFSGLKAAEAIDAALSGSSSALEAYSQVMQEEWGSEMVWAQRLANLFYRVPGIAYKIGVRSPGATQKMVKILCGKLRYSDVASSAIAKLSRSLIPGRR
ncbi:geranylgeranyl reductase family protein [Synechococcus sp. PCC 7336]|uniref:geranylgeranyl reductase family protein n=1 Tax=Synechococcus sp. PCC 7336 TaxID=195250 RepID=UPI000349A9DD|nr:geranylgeranyl reductase family protein [Synechococcus sp. PCC 7336]